MAASILVFVNTSISAQDGPRSKEELSPEVRERYENLYREWTETDQELERVRREAYRADPLLERAVDEYDRANRILSRTSTNQRQKVNEYYTEKGLAALEQFRAWEECRRDILDFDVAREFCNDPEMRQLFSWVVVQAMSAFAQKPSDDQVDSAATAQTGEQEQEFAAYLKSVEEKAQQLAEKCAELERQANPPTFVREYVEEDHYGNSLFGICDFYITKRMPESIIALRNRRGELSRQMDDVWPAWRRVEELKRIAAAAAQHEHELRPASNGSLRWIVGLNVAFVLIVLLIAAARRFVHRQAE